MTDASSWDTRVAVVTGAGSPSGIGFASALALAPTHSLLIAATSRRIDDRVLELVEVAALVAFLASESASYITGQVFIVDAGNSIAEERGYSTDSPL